MRDSSDPVVMDWDKLRIFHAAAEAGSFTHAGDRLGMSQSAVSRQVSGLERDLRVTLFHRHARGLILTEQGEVLFRAVHDVFARLQSAATLIADNSSKPAGDLRVSAAVGLGSSWLTPRLAHFVEQYPEISIQLILDDKELDLSMREADVAIWFREPSQADLIRRPLFNVRFHAYASAGYVAKHGHPHRPEDLDRHRILTYSGPASSPISELNWLVGLGREDGKPRQSALRINNIFALKQAVQAGVGVAVLPDYLVEEGAGFVQVLEAVELREFQAFFVYPEELRNAKKVQVFRDFIVSQARKWRD